LISSVAVTWEQVPSLRTDILKMGPADWTPLFATTPYDAAEKEEFGNEAAQVLELGLGPVR